MHDYHEQLPGYDPRQLLVDGCVECEARSRDLGFAIAKLDPERFARAWRRAQQDAAGDDDELGPVSRCERPLLQVLWAVRQQLDLVGVP